MSRESHPDKRFYRKSAFDNVALMIIFSSCLSAFVANAASAGGCEKIPGKFLNGFIIYENK